LISGSILDDQLVLQAARGVDIFVHLAANTGVELSIRDPRSDCITNVLGTLNCLEAARHQRVKRFILASSGAPMGACEPPVHENKVPHPISPYGASKLAGEGYCSAYFHTFGLETVALRFGNVYGPYSRHKNSVVAKFIRQAMRGEPLDIYGDGHQTRDFIYIDDLVRAIQLAATVEGIGGEIFHIATNAETSVGELVDRLVPVLAQVGITDVRVRYQTLRVGEMRRNFSDTSKAKRLLHWQAQVGLTDGLRETVEWFVGSSR
jgi:UDP-glucose 4-epimerase